LWQPLSHLPSAMVSTSHRLVLALSYREKDEEAIDRVAPDKEAPAREAPGETEVALTTTMMKRRQHQPQPLTQPLLLPTTTLMMTIPQTIMVAAAEPVPLALSGLDRTPTKRRARDKSWKTSGQSSCLLVVQQHRPQSTSTGQTSPTFLPRMPWLLSEPPTRCLQVV
jgi:hypothetical protein